MNINNLLKTCILACTMIFGINNSVNAVENNFEDFFENEDVDNHIKIRHQKVNSKVFQHNVHINNNEDWNLIEYKYYSVPKKKHYMKNPNNERFKEIHEDPWHKDDDKDDDNEKIYMAYADDRDELIYKRYNCVVDHYYFSKLTDVIDTKNKFNELYKKKITGNVIGDTKTKFANAVRRVFGNDYKVIENTAEDFGRVLARYPGNRIQAYTEDWTQKDLIRIFPTSRFGYDIDRINYLLIHNGFELVTRIKGYSWNNGTVVKDEYNEEKKLNMHFCSLNIPITDQFSLAVLKMEIIIITNGCDVIVFDSGKREVDVYRNSYTQNKSKLKSSKDLLNKLNKVGLVLQEAYKKELAIVKEVFGQKFDLYYV